MAYGCQKVVYGGCFSCCLLNVPVLCGLAAAIWVLAPTILISQVNQRVTIMRGHATYEQLQNLTLPLWKSFYFFNLTNPKEFEAGDKPILKEVGPYSYREYRTKNLTCYSPDMTQVTYTQKKVFQFDSSATPSHLSETDTICTINIPFIVGADKVDRSFLERDVFEGLVKLSGAHLYVCQNATPLVWHYTDNLVKDLHALHQYPHEYVNIQVNNSINDTFPSIIRTGVDDINTVGEFIQWDGHNKKLDIWKDDGNCNSIRGTEGLFFHPNLKEGENLTAFVDDAQRSFDLKYVGKVMHLGLEAFRFELANHTFYNLSEYPDNACWKPDKDNYPPKGLFYLGATQYPEIPVYGSNPHFYLGDPSLLHCVTGLNQSNASGKVTKIDVEPITGANIQLQENLQLSVKVKKYDNMMYLKDMKCVDNTYYFPVLWLSEHAELTPDFKQYLEDKGLALVGMFSTLVQVLFGLLLALGVLALCISLCCCCCFIRVSRKSLAEERQPLLVQANDLDGMGRF